MSDTSIADLIKASGKTCETLAAEVGVSVFSIYRWRDDNRVPRDHNRESLATALGVHVSAIGNGGPHKGLTGAVETWARYEFVPPEVLSSVIEGATSRLDVVMGTGLVLLDEAPLAVEHMKIVAAKGTPVRILLGSPESSYSEARGIEEGMGGPEFLERLAGGVARWTEIVGGIEGAELRLFDAPYYLSAVMNQETAVAWFHMFGAVGTSSLPGQINEHHPWWSGLGDHFDNLWEATQ